jgi:DivIVA domain-containing protein
MDWLLWAMVAVVALLGVATAFGRFGGMPKPVLDEPEPHLPEGELTPEALRNVRLAVVRDGYSKAQVKALLERVAAQLEDAAELGTWPPPDVFVPPISTESTSDQHTI